MRLQQLTLEQFHATARCELLRRSRDVLGHKLAYAPIDDWPSELAQDLRRAIQRADGSSMSGAMLGCGYVLQRRHRYKLAPYVLADDEKEDFPHAIDLERGGLDRLPMAVRNVLFVQLVVAPKRTAVHKAKQARARRRHAPLPHSHTPPPHTNIKSW